VLRTISDRADAAAPVDFKAFLQRVASPYATGILNRFIQAWSL
jgi:adenosylhomocysteine nucleosidase